MQFVSGTTTRFSCYLKSTLPLTGALALLLGGCVPGVTDEKVSEDGHSALALSSASSAQAGGGEDAVKLAELEGGALASKVVLPCGQAYVEVFQRANGIQFVAKDITSSEMPIDGGLCAYGTVTDGFQAGDVVETRFYSYLPASTGVFTPGPVEMNWVQHTYAGDVGGEPEIFAGTDTTWDLRPEAGRDVDVYYAEDYSVIVPAMTGWYLQRAATPELSAPTTFNAAAMGRVYIRQCATDAWQPLAEVSSFAYNSATEGVADGIYTFTPTTWNRQLPGTTVNSAYECGGRTIEVSTRIGKVKLTTEAVVKYAFVVVHYQRGR